MTLEKSLTTQILVCQSYDLNLQYLSVLEKIQNINHDLDLFGGAKKLSLKHISLMKLDVNFICSKVLSYLTKRLIYDQIFIDFTRFEHLIDGIQNF